MLSVRMGVLAVLLGCIVTNTAKAKKPSLRSVKNLFVEHTSGFKQWGVSIVAASALTACAFTTAGCTTVRVAPAKPKPAVSVSHNHEAHRDSVMREGIVWHAHANPAYREHGWDQYRGLLADDVQDYHKKFHTLTSNAYHGVAVLYEDKGRYRYGLATRNGTSDDTIIILFPNSNKHETINISQIAGVRYLHKGKVYVKVQKEAVLPWGFGPYESDASVLEDDTSYHFPDVLFTNGMRLVDLPNNEQVLVDVVIDDYDAVR